MEHRIFGRAAQQTTIELDRYRVATDNCWKWAYDTLSRFLEAIPFDLVIVGGRRQGEVLGEIERMRDGHQTWLWTMNRILDKCADSAEAVADSVLELGAKIIHKLPDVRHKLQDAINDPHQITEALNNASMAVTHLRGSLSQSGIDALNALSYLASVIGNHETFFSLLLGSLNLLPGVATGLLITASLQLGLDTADRLLAQWVGHAWHNWHGRIWLRESLAIFRSGFNIQALLLRAAMVVAVPNLQIRQRAAAQ